MRHRSRLATSIVLTALTGAGCAGHAVVYSVPLGTKQISTTDPLIVRATPDECYFWVDDQEELCVAMRSFSGSILGKRFHREFLMSMVAKGLPAGSGREYRMDRRTARTRNDAGYAHTRSASLGGILAVWDYRRGQVRGRFRFTAKEQSYSVLTGWSGNNTVLCIGEFTAFRNETAGKRLLARTEEGAMGRATDDGKAARTSPPAVNPQP
jgi:hypothetical protein